MPKVSIIMPVYNCESYVSDSVNSVLNQSERDLEIIVIDDGSSDGSAERLKMLAAADQRISLLSRPSPGGPALARNLGIRHATGSYISFLDADDLYRPEKIARVIEVFERFPETEIVFHDYERFEAGTQQKESFFDTSNFLRLAAGCLAQKAPAVYLCDRNLYQFASITLNPFHTSSMVIRRQLLNSASEWFRQDMLTGEDLEFWLRLVRNARVAVIAEVLSFYRKRPGSLTSDSERFLLGYLSAHEQNFRHGHEDFDQRGRIAYQSKIAQGFFDLGYFYFRNSQSEKARLAYRQSLSRRFRVGTAVAYLKTFVPKTAVEAYREWRD